MRMFLAPAVGPRDATEQSSFICGLAKAPFLGRLWVNQIMASVHRDASFLAHRRAARALPDSSARIRPPAARRAVTRLGRGLDERDGAIFGLGPH